MRDIFAFENTLQKEYKQGNCSDTAVFRENDTLIPPRQRPNHNVTDATKISVLTEVLLCVNYLFLNYTALPIQFLMYKYCADKNERAVTHHSNDKTCYLEQTS